MIEQGNDSVQISSNLLQIDGVIDGYKKKGCANQIVKTIVRKVLAFLPLNADTIFCIRTLCKPRFSSDADVMTSSLADDNNFDFVRQSHASLASTNCEFERQSHAALASTNCDFERQSHAALALSNSEYERQLPAALLSCKRERERESLRALTLLFRPSSAIAVAS